MANSRTSFIRRTYLHLAGAVTAFVALELFYFHTVIASRILARFAQVPWLAVLGAMMIVGWLASRTAWRARNPRWAYVALAGFVVAKSIIFVPLFHAAERDFSGATRSAAVVTLLGFLGLTAIAFWSGRDFRFLAMLVRWGMMLALVAVVAGLLFGFRLGTGFSVAMVGLAGAAVLTDTAKVLRRYPKHRHVAAALELFSSVALMLWYLVRLIRQGQR